MQTDPPARRVQRVRHELKRRAVRVAAREPLGPGFVRLTFQGESLADFVSLGFDDHVKFILPDSDGDGDALRRDYTPRRHDAARGELQIEFALHAHGRVSDWARHAAVGDAAVIGGPKGSMIVPADFDWHLLAGDATALPAIDRRLEELPAGRRAIVVAQVADADDRRRFATAAELDLHWTTSAAETLATVRALRLPGAEGYAWAAGEAGAMAAMRDLLLGEKGHPREAMRVAAYWKRGAEAFHEELAQALPNPPGR